MLRLNNILLGISLVVVGITTQLKAQTTTAEDGSLSTSIEQIVDKEISLDSAERLFDNAAYAVPREVVVEKQTYEAQDFKLHLNSLDHKIKVFTVKQPPLDDLTKHYVRAGFGNYTTPYLDVFTGSGRKTSLNYALRLKHLSSKKGPRDGKSSGNSENLIDLGTKYHLSNKADVNFNLSYERLGYHLYGYEKSREDLKGIALGDGFVSPDQRLHNFKSSVNIDAKPFDDLELIFGTAFNTVKDNFSAKEREIEGFVDAIYDLSETSKLDIKLDAFLTKRTDSAAITRNYFSFSPMYNQHKGKIKLNAGAKIVYENDTLSNRSNIHVYPRVDVEYQLTTHISPYAGLTGNMVRNTYTSLVTENRFLSSDVVLLNTNKAIEFYGGVKGNLNQKIGFNTRLAYQNFKNLNFFLNNPLSYGTYSVVYEDGNTTVVNFLVELEYEELEKYTFGLRSEVNSFNMSDLDAAFYRPSFETRVFGEHNLKKKLNLNADIFYISGLKALDLTDGEVAKLESIIDLNLGAEYLFNKKLSAFLELNNLLSREYQHYLYYPVRGFNMLLGATYSF